MAQWPTECMSQVPWRKTWWNISGCPLWMIGSTWTMQSKQRQNSLMPLQRWTKNEAWEEEHWVGSRFAASMWIYAKGCNLQSSKWHARIQDPKFSDPTWKQWFVFCWWCPGWPRMGIWTHHTILQTHAWSSGCNTSQSEIFWTMVRFLSNTMKQSIWLFGVHCRWEMDDALCLKRNDAGLYFTIVALHSKTKVKSQAKPGSLKNEPWRTGRRVGGTRGTRGRPHLLTGMLELRVPRKGGSSGPRMQWKEITLSVGLLCFSNKN